MDGLHDARAMFPRSEGALTTVYCEQFSTYKSQI